MRLPHPAARRLDLTEDLFGQRVPDPYRWLEDTSSQQTGDWLAAQEALWTAEASDLPLRERFASRVSELLQTGYVSPPAWRGTTRFFTRRDPGQEHGVLYVANGTFESLRDTEHKVLNSGTAAAMDGARVLIDPMAIDPSGRTTLDQWQPDKEGRLLAYQLSEGGTEESLLRVLDVATGAIVDGPIDRCRYSGVAWLPGGKAFYYVRRLPPGQVPEGEEQYHRRVYLHVVGTDPDGDALVFGDGRDKTSYYGLSVSMDGRWLVVSSSIGTAPRDDVWIADLAASDPARPGFAEVTVGLDAQTSLRPGRDGRLYVFTDLDAPRGRLAVTDPADPRPHAWHDLIPQDPEAVLRGYAILDGVSRGRGEEGAAPPGLSGAPEERGSAAREGGALRRPDRGVRGVVPPGGSVLLCRWTRHGISEVTVHDLASGARLSTLVLPGIGTVGGIAERPEGGDEAWFSYTDYTTPAVVLRYSAATGMLETYATPPGQAERPDVSAFQVTYRSKDGTPVRMVVIEPSGRAAEGAPPAGPVPTILYGYGGFNISMTPGYSANILAWVEAGGAYAVAALRGGSEEGEEWHRAGMLDHKQQVFDDFHAAAEHLIATGVTTPSQLAIWGGSNGGLLVGAAITQRPELFAACVCSAPLLDMARYEKFGLGQTWNTEYGSASVAEELAWLLGYSPYHRVSDGQAYPSVLFTVFTNDTRVHPMHAYKMCAALQHATSSSRPVLMRAEGQVGHGARAVSLTAALAGDALGFVARETGLEA
ncbi:MAG TPA: prolyl oligopeptidase family serine peptidase [Trebonia sp.]|nr:prolyl oligopeptidase family serine peptidase [Trebonia sp.]